MHPNQAPQNQPTIEEQREAFFPAVAAFAQTPDSQYAAGPDVLKATGLTPQKVWELGYGTLDDVKADALTWQAKQDAIEARNAAGKAGADAWHKEVAAGRAAKIEADKAVAQAENKVIADVAAPRAKKLSYHEKISGLGQVGYDRNPKQAVIDQRNSRIKARSQVKDAIKSDPTLGEELHAIAVDMATEQGFATDHLQPRYQPVIMNPAAEARTSKIVDDLKAHQASFSTKARLARQAPTEEAIAEFRAFDRTQTIKQARIENKAFDAAQVHEEAIAENKAFDEEAEFQAQTDAEISRVYEPAQAEHRKRSTTRRARAAAFAGGLIARTATGRRAQAATHKVRGHASTVRGHVSTASAKLGAATTVRTNRFSEWMRDPEDGRNRRMLVKGAIGTIALLMLAKGYSELSPSLGGHAQEAASAATMPLGTGSSRTHQLEVLQAHQQIMGRHTSRLWAIKHRTLQMLLLAMPAMSAPLTQLLSTALMSSLASTHGTYCRTPVFITLWMSLTQQPKNQDIQSNGLVPVRTAQSS